MAAISVGTNPTFDGETRRVEAYVIDEGHELELYDEHVVVEFAHRLRGMERYDGVDALVAQMARDVEHTRDALT
jgi:riboflavin kinase/FMN adenylyltransferase